MSATFRNRFVGDRPRHDQYSTVKDLSLTQLGWITDNTGTVSENGNLNPPQFFVRPGATPQDFVLQCPKGNPKKCWTFFTSHEGIRVMVTDYTTLVDGFLNVRLETAPVTSTRIRGYIAYGRNAGEATGLNGDEDLGEFGIPPKTIKPLISFGQFKVQSVLKQEMMFPVFWVTDAAGEVVLTRASLGTVVTRTGEGVYDIQFDVSFPGLQNRWVDIFGNSENQPASFSYPGGSPQRVTVTLPADMGENEVSAVMFMGPVSKYPNNYGGGGGGVYDDLPARDIDNYTHYPHGSAIRGSSFIPFRIKMSGFGVDPSESALPPGSRIVVRDTGLDIYIGSFANDAIFAAFVVDLAGETVQVADVDHVRGIVRLEFSFIAFPPVDWLISGAILAPTQSVP